MLVNTTLHCPFFFTKRFRVWLVPLVNILTLFISPRSHEAGYGTQPPLTVFGLYVAGRVQTEVELWPLTRSKLEISWRTSSGRMPEPMLYLSEQQKK